MRPSNHFMSPTSSYNVRGMVRLTFILSCLLWGCGLILGQTSPSTFDQEWRVYGHDPGGMRISGLMLINHTNVSKLQRAWTYVVSRGTGIEIEALASTPFLVDGVHSFRTPTRRAIAGD